MEFLYKFLLHNFVSIYHEHENLTWQINDMLDNPIVSVVESPKEDSFYVTVTFEDGSRLHAWYVNRFYGWLSRGILSRPSGATMTWDKRVPSYKVQWKLRRAIQRFLGRKMMPERVIVENANTRKSEIAAEIVAIRKKIEILQGKLNELINNN